jgi:hypothetical protein
MDNSTTPKYRIIKKFLCTWWLQYRKLQVMFKVSPASLQVQSDSKKGNSWKIQICKSFLWPQHAVDRSTDPWLLNGEVVCNSRSLFCSAANCTLLPVRISKVPVFWVILYLLTLWTVFSTSVVPSSNYIIMVCDWNSLKYFLYCAQGLFDHPVAACLSAGACRRQCCRDLHEKYVKVCLHRK